MTFSITTDPVITVTKQLYALLNAGMPLFRSLQILRQQARDAKLQKILDTILHDLAEGQSFSESLKKHTRYFSQFYINMVVVGESRGELPSALQRIIVFFDKSKEFREKLIGALTYPVILLCTGVLVSIVMLLVVLPRFVTIFSSAQIELPLPTRIVLSIQGFVFHNAGALGIALMAAVMGVLYSWLRPKGRRFYDHVLVRLPIVGQIALAIYIVRFSRTLGTLYNSGMQLLPALSVSVRSVGNAWVEEELSLTMASVRDGKGISGPLVKSKLIPPMVSSMIAVGEETGDLERVLLDIADYYDQELDFLLRHIMSIIEPLALICISGFVMFIASSVMLPLFKMSSAVHAF